VIECQVSGALASALGLSCAPPSGSDLECHRDAAVPDCSVGVWGRVVLMRLEGSSADAVLRARCAPRVLRVTRGAGARGRAAASAVGRACCWRAAKMIACCADFCCM